MDGRAWSNAIRLTEEAVSWPKQSKQSRLPRLPRPASETAVSTEGDGDEKHVLGAAGGLRAADGLHTAGANGDLTSTITWLYSLWRLCSGSEECWPYAGAEAK